MTVQGDLDVPAGSRFRAGCGASGVHTGVDIYYNTDGSSAHHTDSVIETRSAGGDLVFRNIDHGQGYQFYAEDAGGTENFIMGLDGANQRVGIGTTAPAYKLDVRHAGYNVALVSGTGNGNYPIFHVIDSTDISTALFESNRAGDQSSRISLWHNPASSHAGSHTAIKFQMNDNGNNRTNFAQIQSGINVITDGSEGGNLAFYTSQAGSLTEQMRIDDAGNVGIGTTSPSAKLHVYGSATDSMQYKTDLGDGFDGIQLVGGNPALKLDGGGSTFVLGALNSGLAVFDQTNGAYRMIIESGGDVGIGTTSPSAKLHVDGDIRIDSGHTLDFESKAYIDVNVNSGTGDDLFYIRRRGSSNEIAFDTSTASAPVIDSPNGTLDLQAASTPVAQLKDDTGFIMGDFVGIKNHVASLSNFPIDAGTGIATADIQGYSKIQNILLDPQFNPPGFVSATSVNVKLPVGVAGMEYIVTLGVTSMNLGNLTLKLLANGSDIIYNAANAVSEITFTKNVGESIHLICFEANKWSVVAHT